MTTRYTVIVDGKTNGRLYKDRATAHEVAEEEDGRVETLRLAEYTEHECTDCGTEFETDEPVPKAEHDAFVCDDCAPDNPPRFGPSMPEGQRMQEAREERRRLMSR